ncbi:hypothetical protein BO82DRAFT_66379 [Aspergillus uvarum CBS 121591]|uniref:Uncharacterized protein n=1 Tax=Aspergillus uvarum CBS 121591 TaxID=1448315 RepID=A0A319C976_9EURO|nr:hypothetical protein BO82DRAFT_66379 [Aspergillus uvarum CBS 121591]PYH82356.1 hypothetical protein BO82DRAFT_66379 [Aspergillus uvarum CBS 121591]
MCCTWPSFIHLSLPIHFFIFSVSVYDSIELSPSTCLLTQLLYIYTDIHKSKKSRVKGPEGVLLLATNLSDYCQLSQVCHIFGDKPWAETNHVSAGANQMKSSPLGLSIQEGLLGIIPVHQWLLAFTAYHSGCLSADFFSVFYSSSFLCFPLLSLFAVHRNEIDRLLHSVGPDKAHSCWRALVSVV